jgi:CheY-like chemotaxis protein
MPRILVVDDNSDVLELLETIFGEEDGWAVTGASSVARARERMKATKYDLVVVDYIMPVDNGLVLAHEASSQMIPVVLVTGADVPDQLEGFHVVRKPFSSKVLFRAINQALRAKNNVLELPPDTPSAPATASEGADRSP